jgi:hypothetical protein
VVCRYAGNRNTDASRWHLTRTIDVTEYRHAMLQSIADFATLRAVPGESATNPTREASCVTSNEPEIPPSKFTDALQGELAAL